MKTLKDYAEEVEAKLDAENWDGSDKHAIAILNEVVAPVFAIKVYNTMGKKGN